MSEVRQTVDLDVSKSITGLERLATLAGQLDNTLQGLNNSQKTSFQAAEKATASYNQKLSEGLQAYSQIEQAVKSAGAAQTKAFADSDKSVSALKKSINSLEIALTSYENVMKNSTDPKVIAEYNRKVTETRKEIERLGNIGKKGFDEMGKPMKAQLGILERLEKKAELYKKAIAQSNNPEFITKYNRKLQETEKQIGQLANKGKKGFDEMGNSIQKQEGILQKFGGMLAGVFAVGAVLAWAKQIGAAILDVTAEFQKFEAVLTTSLGSDSAAERAMLMIQDFAAKTPFSVAELTDAYVKLAGRGLRPTNKELTALGDLAASTGKSFDQLTEAVLDSMSGENERLKEFGILAKKTGETTQFTFKGVTTEVKNSDEAIKDYLISLGKVEGVTGSMAAISETLTGRLSNLGDGLDNLFLTIGQQETGVMASFIGFLSDAVDYTTFLIANTDQLAKKLAAGSISEFATNTESEFKQLAESTKKAGGDVQAVLSAQAEALRKDLESKLAAAQRMAEEAEGMSGGALGFIANPTMYGVNKSSEAAAKASLEQIKGQLAALADAQRFVLDDMSKKENADADRRAQEAIKLAEENTKKAAAARLKAQQDLMRQLEALEDKAAKARLDMLDKNSKAYLDALLENDLKAIQQLEKGILESQKKAGLAVGLSVEQRAQIQALTLEANKRYYDALYAQEQAQRDKLLELQRDSDQKEMQQLENKYDAQIRAAREAANEELAIALESAKALEKAKLTRKQAENNLGTDQELAVAFAENTIPDNLSKIEAERLLQERLLDIQIEFAEKKLALVVNSLDKEDRIKTLQLENEIKRLKSSQQEMKEGAEKFSLQKLLGLDDEQMAGVNQAINYSLGQLQSFLAESVAMREREVQALTNAIDEKGRELDREIELNEQGFASNVETKRQEYEELKAQRIKAEKDRQKAARMQVLLDSAMQASNLITASTQVYASLASIPFVGIPLAVGLIATMFGTFLAAKSKALQATTVPTFGDGGEGRLIEGPSHAQGGIDLVENRSGRKIANIEGKEFFYVTNKKSTDRFWPLLEAINNNDTKGIINYALDELLNGTGVIMPSPELPKKLQALQTNTKVAQQEYVARSVQQAYKANPQLKAIDSTLREMNERDKYSIDVFETETHRTERKGNHTRTIKK